MGCTTPRRAVFTAVFGGYEELSVQPVAAGSSIPFICFTDDPDLKSESWDVRVVEPLFPLDAIRSARAVKIRMPGELEEFDETLWIDNSVQLTQDPNAILDEWLAEDDIAMPRHSYRRNVMAEFDQVGVFGYDDPSRIYEQLIHYSELNPEVLLEAPYWTALVARRRTDEVRAAMSLWMDHVLRYSRRDQLSINYILNSSGLSVRAIEIENFESEFHQWPTEVGRKTGLRSSRYQDALRIPAVQIGRLSNDLDEITEDMRRAVAEREEALQAQQANVAERDEEIRRLSSEIDALRTSRSWRLTAGLRRFSDRVRPR